MRLTGPITLAVALALAGGAPLAHAQDESAYQVAFKEGTELFERGEWAAARAAFERAYDLEPRPILLFNIGSTYRREGNLSLARTFYQRFLEAGSGDTALEEVTRGVIAEIDAALAKEAAEPEPPPPPATVTPTATVAAPAPPPRRRPRTWLVAGGYVSATAGGALIGWALRDRARADELEASAAATGVEREPPGGTGAVLGAGLALAGVGVGATIGGLVLDEAAAGDTPWIARWQPWAVVAVAAGGLGGFYAYRFGQTRDELAAVIADSANHEVADAHALEDRAHREGRVASIALGVAAASAAASVTALIVGLGGEDAPLVQPTASPDGVGVAIGGRF